MPVTGILILRVEDGYKATDGLIIDKLKIGIEIMGSYSGHSHSIFVCCEEPSHILQVGGWDDVEQHFEGLQSSEEMMDIIAELGGFVDIHASFHIDIDQAKLPLHAPIITISRLWVYENNKEKFLQAHENNTSQVGTFTKHKKHMFGGAWRIGSGWEMEKEDLLGEREGMSEFVFVSGWPSLESRAEFVANPGIPDFHKIYQYIEKSNIKHFKRVEMDI